MSMEQRLPKLIIIGYGNPDREDDGVAWHVLNKIAGALGRPQFEEIGEGFQQLGESIDLLFQLQLTPELAETISQYQAVCFVDAHTGNIDKDLNVESISAAYQASAFTHHMTPQTCLSLAASLYQTYPESILVSIRGYQFEFSHNLSPATQTLAHQAAEYILRWVESRGKQLYSRENE